MCMKIHFAIGALVLSIPLFTYASEYDSFLRELDGLSEEIVTQTEALERVQYEMDYEANPDIFPRGAKYDEEVDGYRSAVVSETHVFTKVGDIPVVLNDVPVDTWFAPYVREMSGIISGYTDTNGVPLGLFGPADNVTLAQLAKIAINASGKNTEICPANSVNASAKGSWAEKYIGCAEMYRFSVYLDSAVDVGRPATRAEVVVTMLQAFSVTFENSTGRTYSDVPENHAFKDAVTMASNLGIVSGYKDDNGLATNLFGPDNAINRAETAKIAALAKQVLLK
jgi:S-layer homology domain